MYSYDGDSDKCIHRRESRWHDHFVVPVEVLVDSSPYSTTLYNPDLAHQASAAQLGTDIGRRRLKTLDGMGVRASWLDTPRVFRGWRGTCGSIQCCGARLATQNTGLHSLTLTPLRGTARTGRPSEINMEDGLSWPTTKYNPAVAYLSRSNRLTCPPRSSRTLGRRTRSHPRAT